MPLRGSQKTMKVGHDSRNEYKGSSAYFQSSRGYEQRSLPGMKMTAPEARTNYQQLTAIFEIDDECRVLKGFR